MEPAKDSFHCGGRWFCGCDDNPFVSTLIGVDYVFGRSLYLSQIVSGRLCAAKSADASEMMETIASIVMGSWLVRLRVIIGWVRVLLVVSRWMFLEFSAV